MKNDQISPRELKQKREAGKTCVVLDVREPWEYETAKLPDSILIPLGELSSRVNELDPDQETITLCHHGIRSQSALHLLLHHGFTNVKNMTGGIDAYSQIADPTIPRYG